MKGQQDLRTTLSQTGTRRPLLFAATQDQLLSNLRRVPVAPDPSYEYGTTYDTLKAYLITTSMHQYSTPQFLAPVLYNRYAAGREIDTCDRVVALVGNPNSPVADCDATRMSSHGLGRECAHRCREDPRNGVVG